MDHPHPFTLFHAPGSRSERTRMMLELLEQNYELVPLDTSKQEHKRPEYLALNPFGVVPTLVHKQRVILESAAQMMYLADLFPERGLAPPLGDEKRATYFELFVLSPSELEPRVTRAWRDPKSDESAQTIRSALELWVDRLATPYFLGDQMSAVDVFIHWSMRFFSNEILAHYPALQRYDELMRTHLDWNRS
ncbi:MAG: glutathione S-transferase [Pseudomonadota bacterium]